MDIGFIANPASGKDIRRLTARASVFDNQEKAAIVERCLAGISGIGKANIHYLPDTHNIVSSALQKSKLKGFALPVQVEGTANDSTSAAQKLRGVDVVVSLGGYGTNRAIAKGWMDVPLIALSTGTNNAFPVMVEATTAGLAVALVAQKFVELDQISTVAKLLHVDIADDLSDIALIDVVVTNDRFLGTRALINAESFELAVVSNADPSRVGISGLAGCVQPVAMSDDAGVLLRFNSSHLKGRSFEISAPLASGMVRRVKLADYRLLALG